MSSEAKANRMQIHVFSAMKLLYVPVKEYAIAGHYNRKLSSLDMPCSWVSFVIEALEFIEHD